jgi:hypothetical protein
MRETNSGGAREWLLGHVIEDVTCMKDSKSPEFRSDDFWPIADCMGEHGVGIRDECPNCAFCDAILMMCSDAGECVLLCGLSSRFGEDGFVESTVVRMDATKAVPMTGTESVECLLGKFGV